MPPGQRRHGGLGCPQRARPAPEYPAPEYPAPGYLAPGYLAAALLPPAYLAPPMAAHRVRLCPHCGCPASWPSPRKSLPASFSGVFWYFRPIRPYVGMARPPRLEDWRAGNRLDAHVARRTPARPPRLRRKSPGPRSAVSRRRRRPAAQATCAAVPSMSTGRRGKKNACM